MKNLIRALFKHRGRTHGTKPYKLNVIWDPQGRLLTIQRNTEHQLHEIRMQLRNHDDGNGGTKITPHFIAREVDHPTGTKLLRELDLFTLVHLMVNIHDAEIKTITQRDEGINPNIHIDRRGPND